MIQSPRSSPELKEGDRAGRACVRACTGCKKLKIKCEGAGQPPCTRCNKQGLECLFPKPMQTITLSQRIHDLDGEVAGLRRTQVLILEKLSEMFNYMQSSTGSSSSGSVSPPSSLKLPTQDSNALDPPISNTTFISTNGLLPTRFGSILRNKEESSPSDHATPANRGDLNYGMDPTLSSFSTVPPDRFWPTPHHQEGHSNEVASGFADTNAQIRNSGGPHKRKAAPSPEQQPSTKKRRVRSGQSRSVVAAIDTTPHDYPPSMEVGALHGSFFIPPTADVDHAGFNLYSNTDLTGQTTHHTYSNTHIPLDTF